MADISESSRSDSGDGRPILSDSMKKRTLSLAVCAALIGSCANAATAFGDHVLLSGFGTVGAVVTDNDQDVFVRETAPEGATRRASWAVDSKMGLQADVRAGWFGATAQVLAEQRLEPGVRADLEWGYLSLDPTPGLSLRFGRTAPAVFMVSDGRNVGYANTMVRMPNEVYALNFLKRVQGGDVAYRVPVGSTTLTLSGTAGEGTIGSGPSKLDASKVRGVNAVLSTDIGDFRLGQFRADVVVPPSRSGLPEEFFVPYTFSGVGYQFEGERLRLAAEYVKRKVGGIIPGMDAQGWYAMAGYRVGQLTPYLSFAGLKSGPVAVITRTSGQQRSTTLGMRWDVVPGAAVKLQVDQVDPKGTVGASFSPTVPGPGNKTNVLSVAVDFIF